MTEVEDRLRQSLLSHADEAPNGRALAERIIAGGSGATVRSGRRRHDWRMWGLPLVSAAAVGAVVAAVVVVNDNHREAAPQQPANSTVISPAPTGVGLQTSLDALSVTMLDAREGWALGSLTCANDAKCAPSLVAEPAEILHTTDGGMHWTTLSSVAGAGIVGSDQCGSKQPCVGGVLFVDSENGYVYGSTTTYVTRDGGQTWQSDGSGGTYAMATAKGNAYRAVSSPTGCEPPGCAYLLQRKLYGAKSWVSVYPHPITTSGSMSTGLQLLASGADVYAMAVGRPAGGSQSAKSTLAISHDFGSTWNVRGDPCVPSSQNAEAIETDGTSMSVAPDGTVAVVCTPRQQGRAASSFIELSGDHAGTFQRAEDSWPTADPIVNVAVSSASNVCLSTEKAVYCAHGDSSSWMKTSTVNVLRFTSITDGYGVSVVNDGTNVTSTLWTTPDGGLTWQSSDVAPQQSLPQASPTQSTSPSSPASLPEAGDVIPAQVERLSFVGTNDIWAAGGAACADEPDPCPALAHSTDDGKSWSPRPMPAPFCNAVTTAMAACVDQIRFVNDKIGYAYAANVNVKTLYMTTDGAKTWKQQPGGAIALESLNGNVVRLVGDHSGCPGPCNVRVEYASIGGARWTTVTLPEPFGWPSGDIPNVTALYRTGHRVFAWLDAQTHAGAIQPGALFSSADDGHTWAVQNDPCTSLGAYAINTLGTAPDGSISLFCLGSPDTPPTSPYTEVIMTSNNGGGTWNHGPQIPTMSASEGRGPVYDRLVPATSSTAVAEAAGGVFRTTDQGGHWINVISDTSKGGMGWCGFQTTTVGHCLHNDGTQLFTTTDGGQTWSAKSFAAPNAPSAPSVGATSRH